MLTLKIIAESLIRNKIADEFMREGFGMDGKESIIVDSDVSTGLKLIEAMQSDLEEPSLLDLDIKIDWLNVSKDFIEISFKSCK